MKGSTKKYLGGEEMSHTLQTFLDRNLAELKAHGLYNEIEPLAHGNGPLIQIGDRELINLASNNYLGLATDARLVTAAKAALDSWGVGAGAVRTINGTLQLHLDLEAALADFKGTEAAIVYQSGFNSNLAAIAAVMGPKDVILSDELNHASIIDGCRLAGATIVRFKHSDMADLRSKAAEAQQSGQYEKAMVITDGVFSMDGDICRLPEIVQIAQDHQLLVYVDDAHGSGVLGEGRGTVKHFGLEKEVDVQMGTLSKALGVVGGYVAGSQALIDWLKARSRPFLFSTALTPADTAAAIEAVALLQADASLPQQLWRNATYFKEKLQAMGFETGSTETPITPVIIGSESTAQAFSQRLYEKGVYVKAIVFPTVPLGTGRLRNMPLAVHTQAMLDQALASYEEVGREFQLI